MDPCLYSKSGEKDLKHLTDQPPCNSELRVIMLVFGLGHSCKRAFPHKYINIYGMYKYLST